MEQLIEVSKYFVSMLIGGCLWCIVNTWLTQHRDTATWKADLEKLAKKSKQRSSEKGTGIENSPVIKHYNAWKNTALD